MKKKTIHRIAQEAGLPIGWYSLAYFEGSKLVKGMPPCLVYFVELIEREIKKKGIPNGKES